MKILSQLSLVIAGSVPSIPERELDRTDDPQLFGGGRNLLKKWAIGAQLVGCMHCPPADRPLSPKTPPQASVPGIPVIKVSNGIGMCADLIQT